MRRFVLAFAVLVFATLSAQAQTQTTLVHFGVPFRGGTANLGAVHFENLDAHGNGNVILALGDMAQTAKTLQPLASALLSAHGVKIDDIYLLDLPGHGNSDYTPGFGLGEFELEDYATIFLGAVAELHPNAIIAHGMGAVIVMVAQTQLVASGSTLAGAYGVESATFIAPAIPASTPTSSWGAADAGSIAPLIAAFTRVDATQGTILDLLTSPAGPQWWVGLNYGDRNGSVRGSTTPDVAVANGFIAFESARAALRAMGTDRPSVPDGTFDAALGTTLGIVALEQDQLFAFPGEQDALYLRLTGDAHRKLFFPIAGADTIHNLHELDPAALVPAIKRVLR